MFSRQHRPRPAVLLGALAGLCMIATLGCGDDTPAAPTVPNTPAGIAGRITSVVPDGNFRGTIRVEFNPQSTSGTPKAVVTVTGASFIFLPSRVEGDFRSLSTGQWVRVWFDGPILESYPVQGVAGTVAIDSLGIGIAN